MFTYFVLFHAAPAVQVGRDELERFASIIATTPHLARAHVYTPARAHDPMTENPPPPALAAQLYFDEMGALESALAPDGHLQALARADTLPSLVGARVEQQTMLVRPFAVPSPEFAPGVVPCTFLVEYPGVAQNLNEWLWYYLNHHPQLMAQQPAIREVEVCTRLDWCGFLPWPRVDRMQRNKVTFDSEAALDAALASDMRKRMREDYYKFPPFTGHNIHYPMHTRILRG